MEVPFVWTSDSLGGNYFEKTAIYIPVTFEFDTGHYYFQFDTGSDASFIYNSNLKDSLFLNHFIQVDSVSSSIGWMTLLKHPSMSFEKASFTCIGTLGADFIKNKILEIDYPNQTIHFLTGYDTNEYDLSTVILSYGRPVLSFAVKGKSYPFLFDTGSSMFELWTTKRNWKKWHDKSASVISVPINSWGKTYTSFGSAPLDIIHSEFNLKNSVSTIWYNESDHFKKQFDQINVAGILGNKLFWEDVILIDLQRDLFGIKK